MTPLAGLRTVGSMKSTTVTSLSPVTWAGLCKGEDSTQTEQEEESGAEHVSVVTGADWRTKQSSLD